jgi:hypothetical protein
VYKVTRYPVQIGAVLATILATVSPLGPARAGASEGRTVTQPVAGAWSGGKETLGDFSLHRT